MTVKAEQLEQPRKNTKETSTARHQPEHGPPTATEVG